MVGFRITPLLAVNNNNNNNNIIRYRNGYVSLVFSIGFDSILESSKNIKTNRYILKLRMINMCYSAVLYKRALVKYTLTIICQMMIVIQICETA